MKVLLMHRTNARWEAGERPPPDLVAGMSALIRQMAAAGVFVDRGGLRASSLGVRLDFVGGEWRATAPVLVVPVTSTMWSTPGSSVLSPPRILAIGTALYEPVSGMRWRNEGAAAARLIAFETRLSVRPDTR